MTAVHFADRRKEGQNAPLTFLLPSDLGVKKSPYRLVPNGEAEEGQPHWVI